MTRAIQNYDIVVIRGCIKFKPEWFEVLENIYQKSILLVGQLINTRFEGNEDITTYGSEWRNGWTIKNMRVRCMWCLDAKWNQGEMKS